MDYSLMKTIFYNDLYHGGTPLYIYPYIFHDGFFKWRIPYCHHGCSMRFKTSLWSNHLDDLGMRS